MLVESIKGLKHFFFQTIESVCWQRNIERKRIEKKTRRVRSWTARTADSCLVSSWRRPRPSLGLLVELRPLTSWAGLKGRTGRIQTIPSSLLHPFLPDPSSSLRLVFIAALRPPPPPPPPPPPQLSPAEEEFPVMMCSKGQALLWRGDSFIFHFPTSS